MTTQLVGLRKELTELLPKDKEVHTKHLVALEEACARAEARIEGLRRRRKLLDDLVADTTQTRNFREPTRHEEVQRRFAAVGMTPEAWDVFRMIFAGNVDLELQTAASALDREVKYEIEGDPSRPIDFAKTPLADWPLDQLRVARDATKKEVGIDAARQKKYDQLQRTITQQEATLRRVEADHAHAKGAQQRRTALLNRRRDEYVEVFKTFVDEERILNNLYGPLRKSLAEAQGTLEKLAFIVRRHVNIEDWVMQGEKLLDLRRKSRFRGHGALRQRATEYLVEAWTNGSPRDVADAMDHFRNDFLQDLLKAQPEMSDPQERRSWAQALGAWLYSTNHISVQYGIMYDGTPIERLSPGTRGIVLLLLYLAVDTHDRRPLLIDQPEENLDPHSVFRELVPHFRAAKQRRQVIVVTHNANLVVNTDADQIIVATSQRTEQGGLPTITYKSGSIENPTIRDAVCRLLEGGPRAFLERERRYRIHWGDVEAAEDVEDNKPTVSGAEA